MASGFHRAVGYLACAGDVAGVRSVALLQLAEFHVDCGDLIDDGFLLLDGGRGDDVVLGVGAELLAGVLRPQDSEFRLRGEGPMDVGMFPI